jgi:hypothetical protein
MIHALMNKLSLAEQSAVFCSEKSADKLKQLKFKAAYEDWDNAKMKQVNWMTSRFYSALDIELDEQPNVLMITDVYIAQWTMFDPFTDSVQVVGRFRNGVSSFTHISNYDYRIPYHARLFFQAKCECDKSIYESMTTFYKDAPTDEYRAAYYDVLQVLPYKKFLKEDGQVNYFKIDNYIDEETVKVLYSNSDQLLAAYNQSCYFNVINKPFNYKFSDYERLKIESKAASIREKRKEIVTQLEQLGDCETEAECQYKRDLAFADSEIVEAYDLLGKAEIERLRYSVTKIREAVILKKHQVKAYATDAIHLINTFFYPQKWYSAKTIKEKIKEIFTELEIPTSKAITSRTITEYFDAREQKKRSGRGYFLISAKFV